MKAKCVGGVLNGNEVEIRGERIKAPRPIPLQDILPDPMLSPAVEHTIEYDWYDLEHVGPRDWRYRLSK